MSKPLIIGAAAVVIIIAALFIFLGDNLSEQEIFAMAEQAYGKGNFAESIDLYKELLETYPESEHKPDALFMCGYMYANELKDAENAHPYLTDFIANYPEHQLVSAAQFELEHLGKSEDELGKILEGLIENSSGEEKVKK